MYIDFTFPTSHFTLQEMEAFKRKREEEKKNERLIFIARMFEYERFMGIDENAIADDPLYYNNRFDKLYDMNFYELEDLEHQMHGCVSEYGQIILEQKAAQHGTIQPPSLL